MERMTILELRDRLNFYMEKAGVAKNAPVYFGETPVTYSELWEEYESDTSDELIDYVVLGCHAGFRDFADCAQEAADALKEIKWS